MRPAPFATAADPAPDFVVIDVETACSRVSSICQVGIVGFRDGRETFAYETLVDPCDEFHAANIRIHGIAAERVIGQPTFAQLHAAIDGHLTGRITVAHSHFDKGALAAACRIHDRPTIETRWLDSVRVAKRAWPDLPNHRLGGLARYLGIAHRHHDALSDARAAGWVIVKAIDHTGLSLADWMAPPRPPGPAPRPAADGPLRGERIAILGEPRDGAVARTVAAMGGTVMTAPGSTTTMLVVAAAEPYPLSIRRSPLWQRVQQLTAAGRPIRVVTAATIAALGQSVSA
ncbi:exonuclease domain-containing protein [Sphingomonas sp. CFBP 13720]|uniref:exonuclease domain-containing protein n=1 Tax=Sphingomonas sp. CFBP 13720 TaxID=2775302 RepID=UPI00178185DC|nr:exonuclease domain-containing protein [Sphingomonas sp. CFBP 13720]MBD8677407.1 transposase [Sphingomonas sp. CFBP 13720]